MELKDYIKKVSIFRSEAPPHWNGLSTIVLILTKQYYFIAGDAMLLIKLPLEQKIPDHQKHL